MKDRKKPLRTGGREWQGLQLFMEAPGNTLRDTEFLTRMAALMPTVKDNTVVASRCDLVRRQYIEPVCAKPYTLRITDLGRSVFQAAQPIKRGRKKTKKPPLLFSQTEPIVRRFGEDKPPKPRKFKAPGMRLRQPGETRDEFLQRVDNVQAKALARAIEEQEAEWRRVQKAEQLEEQEMREVPLTQPAEVTKTALAWSSPWSLGQAHA